MDLEFSPEEIAFREEVRTFIAENYPAQLRGKQDEGDELSKEDFLSWHRVLHAKGWVAPAWPVEYGGTGWTVTSARKPRKKPVKALFMTSRRAR